MLPPAQRVEKLEGGQLHQHRGQTAHATNNRQGQRVMRPMDTRDGTHRGKGQFDKKECTGSLPNGVTE